MRHIILRGLQREKNRGLIRVRKTSRFRREGPEQITHAPRQTANRGGSHFATRASFGAVEQIKIRFLQSPLWSEHEDRIAAYALGEEIAHPLDARAGFARARGTGDEEFKVKGRVNYLTLKQVEACPERSRRGRHEARVQ